MPELLKMRERPDGFLAGTQIDHHSQQFDYIAELHGILWRFVRAVNPAASGDLHTHIPFALFKLETMRERGDFT